MPETITYVTPDDLASLSDTVSTLSDQVNQLAERVSALEEQGTSHVAAPLLGSSALNNDHNTFKTFMNLLGGWDDKSLHYTFQPSFKADFTTWSASGCSDHLVFASTKWATPTANNFVTLVNSIPNDGKEHRIVMYQEPEDNMSAADFQKIVRYLWQAVQSSGRTDILICLNLQVFWNSMKGGSSAYIFDAANGNQVYADVVGWSFWPHPNTGAVTDMAQLQAAIDLTDSSGAKFAISSFIMTGTENAAYLAGIVSSTAALLTARYAANKPTDHVVVYWDGTNAPGVNATVQAATKSMFTALKNLGQSA